MPTYYNILTNTGLALDAAAKAGGAPLDFAEFAVGDGNGVYFDPLPTQIGLVHEVWRGAVNRVYVPAANPNWVVIEARIPIADGGFDIREAGIFNAAGQMIGVGKYPLTTKPAVGSGSEKDLYVRMILQVTNAVDVVQTIDPTLVMASQQYVDDHGARTDNPHGVSPAQIGAETPAGAQTKVDTHAALTAPHSATSAATADRLMLRDPAGRAKVAAPAAADDIARKDTVDAAIAALIAASPAALDTLNELAAALGDDPNFATTMTTALAGKETPTGAQLKVNTHAALTSTAHGATSAATPIKLMVRDANGRAKVASPFASDDIARKDTVDNAVAGITSYGGVGSYFASPMPTPAANGAYVAGSALNPAMAGTWRCHGSSGASSELSGDGGIQHQLFIRIV